MKQLALAAVACLVVTEASATDWAFIGIDKAYETSYWMNVSSRHMEEKYAYVWLADVSSSASTKHDVRLSYYQADCKTYDYTMLEASYYAKGKLLSTTKDGGTFSAGNQHSLSWLIVNSMCTGRTQHGIVHPFTGPAELAEIGIKLNNGLKEGAEKRRGQPF